LHAALDDFDGFDLALIDRGGKALSSLTYANHAQP
jgi:hypothetical protein